MSIPSDIQTEITRIANAKAAIKTAIEGKGVTVLETTMLDGFAVLIDSISAGGGELNATCGEITPTSDQNNYSLSHGLGEIPRAFFIGMRTSYLRLSGKKNILLGAWGMRDHDIQYTMYATSNLRTPTGGVREGAITGSGLQCSLTDANASTITVADSAGTFVLTGEATYFWVAVGSEPS